MVNLKVQSACFAKLIISIGYTVVAPIFPFEFESH